ncbi:MAG TPA: BlaI/MecI/CopY family transcriptional regulator [Bacteroidales bacterium]|nr:BlaI/MecI/CopY family transcriptional regulator [Bacteroidales bacterium]
MQEITKAQEEILQALWEINKGAVSDVLSVLEEPKPAYNTVATVIKVLEAKGYVQHVTYGKTHVYSPKITKTEYAQHVLKETFRGLFDGSTKQLFSCFLKSEDVSLKELDELKQLIESKIEKAK